MVKIGNVNLNITPELQDFLRQTAPKQVKKAVITRRKDFKDDFIQDTDEDGNPKFINATIDTHPFVYFDSRGNYYFRVFRSTNVEFEGKDVEVLVTNPKVETKKDCNLYAKGLVSHRQPIAGSEFWDNGRSDLTKHTETICKGDPQYKIVKVMSREEVLDVDLKPTGDNIVANIANSSDAEKEVMVKQLTGLTPEMIALLKNPDVLKKLNEMSE